jgi:ornithine carbamoyltransferase
VSRTVTAATPPDLLRVADLSPDGLVHLLDLATRMKAEPRGWLSSHAGETLTMIFEKPSTRTRVSFAAAAHRLGMLPVSLSPADLQLSRSETVADTARALAEYSGAIVVRTFAHQLLVEMAAASKVPVINALSDAHHPCQALADLLTIRERIGRLGGVRLAYVGDGDNNVVHSLIEAAALARFQLAIACPPARCPQESILEAAVALCALGGGSIEVVADPVAAVTGAHAVYTDVWVSMGSESEQAERLQGLRPYQVTSELMRHARSDAFFMHCLPAHRGLEVTEEVLDGPASAVWQQAGNRQHTEQALLHMLITAATSG